MNPLRTRHARRRPTSRTLELVALEDRVVLNGLSLVSNWNNGTPRYADGWADDRGDRKIAYMGHYFNTNGIYILDITDPASPWLVSTFKKDYVKQFQDVETTKIGNRWIGLFSSDDDDGLFVVDVTDPANPVELANIKSQHGGTNTVHTLSVWGNYVFEADSRTSTIRVFNISVPENPVWVRNIVSQSQHAVHEVTVIGGRMYTANIWGGGSAEVWDVRRIARPGAPVQFLGVMFPGTMTHTSWPTEDGQYMATAREAKGGDLGFWDIRNPAAPVKLWQISVPSTEACCVHQVLIKGNLLYASWYQNGIHVFDISNPQTPAFVGSYDTYPEPVDIRDTYDGAWGVFPYPGDASQLLGFDLKTGMYVLKIEPDPPAPLPSLRQTAPGEYVLESTTSFVDNDAPTLRDVPPGDSVQLVGSVLRIVLSDNDHAVMISRNRATQTIDVTVDGTSHSYSVDQVTQVNVYGGAGDDTVTVDPMLGLPIYADGGGGFNSAVGWPSIKLHNSQHVTRNVNGVFVHGLKGSAARADRFQRVKYAASPFFAAHGLHGVGTGTSLSTAHGDVTIGAMSAKHSGVPNSLMRSGGGAINLTMGAGHNGGVIAPELMYRTSTNSQVGGQIAYHKPG